MTSHFMDINVSKMDSDSFSYITILKSVFLIFLVMRFLNGYSEYYKSYVEFTDASIDVRLIKFG